MPVLDEKERILQSLDGIKKTQAPAFFYARLMARIGKGTSAEKPVFILFRPAFLAACMTLAVIINSTVLFNRQHNPATLIQDNAASGIESFDNDYNLSGSGQLYE